MLDDNDRQWISEQFRQMGTQIERVDAKIERVETNLLTELHNHKQWTLEQSQELREKIERIETSLLTEFHKWASPAEMRARSHALALRAMDLELEALDDRVKKLEEKKRPDAA